MTKNKAKKQTLKSKTIIGGIKQKSFKSLLAVTILSVLALTVIGITGLAYYQSRNASAVGNNWTPIQFNNVTMKVCIVGNSSTPRYRTKVYMPSSRVVWAQVIVNKVGHGQHEYRRLVSADFNKVLEFPDRSGGTPRTSYFKVNIGTDTVTKGINRANINKCEILADAPNGVRWDRVARCESGGNWEAISGNGLYYGGLQFHLSTWRAYGGTERPDQHSRVEQIIVAERLRKDLGISPWPNCGRHW